VVVAAIWANLGAVAAALTLNLLGAFEATKKLNEETAKSLRLQDEMREATTKRLEKRLAELEAITDPGARKEALAAEFKRAQEEAGGTRDRMKELAKEAKDLGGIFAGWFGRESVAIAQRDKALQSLQVWADYLRKLRAMMEKIVLPWEDPANIKALGELNKRMELATDTMGMSAEAVEVYKMRMLGLRDVDLEEAEARLYNLEIARAWTESKNEEAKAAADLKQDLKGLWQTLEDEVIELKEGEGAAKLYRLALRGVNYEALDAISIKQREKKALEDHKKLLEDARRTMEQFAPPEAQFAMKLAELNKQFLAKDSTLTWEAYANAVKKAREEVNGLVQSLEKFDHVSASSAESARRVRDFLAVVKRMGTEEAEPLAVMPRVVEQGPMPQRAPGVRPGERELDKMPGTPSPLEGPKLLEELNRMVREGVVKTLEQIRDKEGDMLTIRGERFP